MDGWMQKPINFDSTKKYPVLFLYIPNRFNDRKDEFGVTNCSIYPGSLAKDGYIYLSLDNGTPAPRAA
jgi:dipeptidyl-peptidase-4